MVAGDTAATAMLHFGFWVQNLKCVQLIPTQMPALQVPPVLNTVLPLLAAALLLCYSYLHTELPATASCHEKKRKDYTFQRQFNEKTTVVSGCPTVQPGCAGASCHATCIFCCVATPGRPL